MYEQVGEPLARAMPHVYPSIYLLYICLSVSLAAVFAFFLLARLYGHMPLALLSTLNCAAVCFSLYMYVLTPRNPHLPPMDRRKKKEKRVDVSKWHQKYLRFIMTTDISLFDICVAAGAGDGGLKPPEPPLYPPPQPAFHVIRFN